MSTTSNHELPEVDLTPLEQATNQFERAVSAYRLNPENEFIRDAVIQRFEFTYELSFKMLRRYLRSIAASDEMDELSFRDLIRRASDLKLVQGDMAAWLEFRQARNDTVHTYNEIRAVEVAEATSKFALEARALLDALKEKIQP